MGYWLRIDQATQRAAVVSWVGIGGVCRYSSLDYPFSRAKFSVPLESPKQQHDELKVRIRLAITEVRDEWDELEKQRQRFVPNKDRLKNDLAPTVENAHVAWLLLKDEIGKGFRTIRNRL
jgi:hypothetical protein